MSEKMKKQAQSGATATKAGTSADSSSTPETATTASDGSDKEETPTGDGSVGKNVDGSKTKELQERLDSIVKERMRSRQNLIKLKRTTERICNNSWRS